MLYFILAWIVLTFICVCIGTAILNALEADCFARRSDRLFVAVWVGIVVLAISLLAVSLVSPLSSLVGLTLAVILVCLSLQAHRTRTEIIALWSSLSPGLILKFLILEFAVALLTSQQIVWFDTGLYHLGSIRWLSEFGAVPGVALINPKFGFTSSWFALSAPLLPKFLGNHVGAITNGFIFLIATWQLIVTLSRIILKKSIDVFDWFIVIFLLIAVSVYTLTSFKSPILISFSPDVSVNLLIGVIAWTILVVANRRTSGRPNLDAKAIPLILSAGAVTIKLSALPLIGVALLFYSFSNTFKVQRLFWGSLILTLLLLPMLIFSVFTSGCPLYPSTILCLDLPWTVTIQQAITEVKTTRGWGKLVGSKPNSMSYLIGEFWTWLKLARKLQLLTGLIVVSIIFTIIITFLASSYRTTKGQAWLIGIGILGMIFIVIEGPLLRFGLGYFIVIPSLFIAILCKNKFDRIQPILVERLALFLGKSNISKIILLVPLLFIGAAASACFHSEVRSRLLLPPELPTAKVLTGKVNDVEYIYPVNYSIKCWAADLPCAPLPINENIKLRDPRYGIRGGFIHLK